MVQSMKSVAQLSREIHVLNEFPCVAVQANEMDNNLPLLQWQPQAAQSAVLRFKYVILFLLS